VGGAFSEPALRSLGWGGRFLVVGFAAGDIPKIPLNLTLLKGASIVGVFWGEFTRREPEKNAANVSELLGWLASGRVSFSHVDVIGEEATDRTPSGFAPSDHAGVIASVVLEP